MHIWAILLGAVLFFIGIGIIIRAWGTHGVRYNAAVVAVIVGYAVAVIGACLLATAIMVPASL